MRLLYQFTINTYFALIRLWAWFNPKAHKWVAGQKTNWQHLEAHATDSKRWLWFHAASLGEFEQGRPVIEALKTKYPDFLILLTFFSPSGYEVRKDYAHADCVAYLPPDSARNANRLLNIFRPKAVFFIKNEFWYNYLRKLALKQIPLFYISVQFRPEQYFFKDYGHWFRQQLHAVTHFFVQDQTSLDLLNGNGFLNASLAGDTRFDRVLALARQSDGFPAIEQFIADAPCMVLGSTWPQDEKWLIPLIHKMPENYKFIIAPHDVGPTHIKQIAKQLKMKHRLWSSFVMEADTRVLIVDSIGILGRLYRYANFAYIGGGFGAGLHNIQEAVTYGCPVIIGPNHTKFNEAVDLVKRGGAFVVRGKQDIKTILHKLVTDVDLRLKASQVCKAYVKAQSGATQLILKKVKPFFEQI